MAGDKSGAATEETPSDIRKRLRREAEDEGSEETEPKGEEEEEEEEEKGSVRTPDSEMAAVRGGKKAGAMKEAAKGRSAQPAKETTKAAGKKSPAATPINEKENEEMKKKAGKKAAKKSGAAKAERKTRIKYSGNIQKEFPVGSKIKYTGTRVAKHTGKTGEVTGHKNADGLNITFTDGSKGTATAGAVEILKKGAGKK